MWHSLVRDAGKGLQDTAISPCKGQKNDLAAVSMTLATTWLARWHTGDEPAVEAVVHEHCCTTSLPTLMNLTSDLIAALKMLGLAVNYISVKTGMKRC